ncbi:MAG: SusC/RagA family TonB-linked outer membrane protein, partial [Bacteroidales bacterium]|nr:SusC/RagA family TonB-linked outer membrane protein [Bacteroidales bacterium]
MKNKTKKLQVILFCLMLIGLNTAVVAQQSAINVSGTVTDATGETLVGVTISISGTNTGTVTNIDGRYSLTVPNGSSVLRFSYLGYKTQEITVGSQRVIDVVLEGNQHQLDEVVITGFGNLRAFNTNGSASMIRTESLQGIPNQTVASMIQGNAPGISVNTTSSQPGGVSSLRIRGYGSFNASNSPLYVIDGVPVMSGDFNSTGRSGQSGGTDIMSTLNPNDIANITIIKDAAAASLWGSRAANGVILITTRQGERGRTRVRFSSDFGRSDFAYHYRPMMDGEERQQFIYDSYVRKGRYFDGLSEEAAIAYADGMLAADAALAHPKWSVAPWSGWTDWRAEALRKGAHHNQEISLSGGTDKFSYFSSLAYNKSQGVQKIQELDRLTGRMNVTYQAKNWLKFGGNLMFSDMTQSLGYDANWYSSPMYGAFVKNTPSDPVYNEDGSFNTIFVGPNTRNIVAMQKLNENEQRLTRAFNTMFAEVQALPELSFKTSLSYDFTMSRGDRWSHPMVSDQVVADNNGQTDRRYDEYRQLVWSTNANYVKTFDKNHNVDALIAYEITDYYDNFLNSSNRNFLNYNYTEPSLGSDPVSISGHYAQDKMVSYISRANYNWKYKYYVGASFRRDGTSRLHADSRWGNFWSTSAGWRFMEEQFLSGIKDIFTSGMLRTSYGVNGTRPSGRYAYMSLTGLTNSYNGSTALIESSFNDKDLSWEKNH